eukprot:4267265-Prymnesium_polylepis.1
MEWARIKLWLIPGRVPSRSNTIDPSLRDGWLCPPRPLGMRCWGALAAGRARIACAVRSAVQLPRVGARRVDADAPRLLDDVVDVDAVECGALLLVADEGLEVALPPCIWRAGLG